MSWSRRQVWRLLAAAAAIAPLAGLAACGFQPLYGSDGRRNLGDESVAASLATVRIDPLRDRAGQQMHNFLSARLNPAGQPVSPSRSEERRVGKAGVSTCRSRWSPD